MSYTEAPAMPDASMFDNVFVDPAAWAAFKTSGHWPDKTVFVMENRGAHSKGSINKRGHYQTTELMGLEFHVRDDSRFKGAGPSSHPTAQPRIADSDRSTLLQLS